nr:hypothetical protein [Treponema sp.]
MKKIKRFLPLVTALSFLFYAGTFVSCASDDSDSTSEDSNPGENSPSENSENAATNYDDSSLSACTVWVVGDSTVCDYTKEDGTLTDATYFYPRYGYGTQLSNYLSSKITVKNLALSGRSSKSFLSEDNYTTLKDGIKSGDFLIVGFGHNDEKSDDAERFTD